MTIYALSSGSSVSGIGVIRVSGSETKNVISKLNFSVKVNMNNYNIA